MKIALIGSSGYIGLKFYKRLTSLGHDIIRVSYSDIISSLFTNTTSRFHRDKIECIFNAAGFIGKPNVDVCEDKQVECYQGNVILPALLTDIAHRLNIPLIHVSTGCIYNGYEKVYTEEDNPNFCFSSGSCSYYSGCKDLAERLVRAYEKHYLLRIRLPFDSDLNNSRNYLNKIINYPTLVNVTNSCTNTDEFVNLLSNRIFTLEFGTYNCVNEDPISTLDVHNLLIKYNLIKEPKKFMSYSEFESKIKARRSNCILSHKKLLDKGIKFSNTLHSIEKCITSYLKIS